MLLPKQRQSVGAVIVIFYPQLALLQRIVARIVPQVEQVLIVNNGSPPEVLDWLSDHRHGSNFEVLDLGDNLGIAAAQNRGIGWAQGRGFEYVLLLDQDSEPAGNMVERLRNAFDALQAEGEPVAAVGPRVLRSAPTRIGPLLSARALQTAAASLCRREMHSPGRGRFPYFLGHAYFPWGAPSDRRDGGSAVHRCG